MARVPHSEIIADKTYRQKIEMAREKAQAACDKAHARLSKREEKLLRELSQISMSRRGIFHEVYRSIFDPLDEAAYADAEKRLSSKAGA